MTRKLKDNILQALIYGSAAFTVLVLAVLIGFILYKGLGGINIKFLTSMWDNKTTFVTAEKMAEPATLIGDGYVESLGITVGSNEDGRIYIEEIDQKSTLKNAVNMKNEEYPLKKGDLLTRVGDSPMDGMTVKEAVSALNSAGDTIKLKAVRVGGGIIPMLVSTIYLIVLSILISAPIGILTALYLNEYAVKGKTLNLIRYAIQNLAGIPSIIYGLFGMLVFVQMMNMKYSILAGALTMSIILLPTIITTTEESLKTIPKSYRESSLGLGATKLQTNFRVVLPNALPGIMTAVLLSIGRVVGESAALIFTAGTVAQIPTALTGDSAGAATLTTKLYWVLKETGDLNTACSIAVILLVLIIALNTISRLIVSRLTVNQGNK